MAKITGTIEVRFDETQLLELQRKLLELTEHRTPTDPAPVGLLAAACVAAGSSRQVTRRTFLGLFRSRA